jgi:hypothetical protein
MSAGSKRRNESKHPSKAPKCEVGYKKPPVEHRFKPGQSGNANGRPRGARNHPRPASNTDLQDIIAEEKQRLVTVDSPKGPVTMTMAAAITRSTFVSAAKGSVRAQRLSTDLIRAQETENKREVDHAIEVYQNYKTSWIAELARRKKLGIIMPPPLPHPDDIEIHYAERYVLIKGPATEEEKAAWPRWERYRDKLEAELRELQTEQEASGCPNRKILRKEIKRLQCVLEIVDHALNGNREAMSLLETVWKQVRRDHPEDFSDGQ